jgi:hypothetical protein
VICDLWFPPGAKVWTQRMQHFIRNGRQVHTGVWHF